MRLLPDSLMLTQSKFKIGPRHIRMRRIKHRSLANILPPPDTIHQVSNFWTKILEVFYIWYFLLTVETICLLRFIGFFDNTKIKGNLIEKSVFRIEWVICFTYSFFPPNGMFFKLWPKSTCSILSRLEEISTQVILVL